MRNAMSMTDLVRLAASNDKSLTEEVQKAAREGADHTVISFPRTLGRHGTPWSAGHARVVAPAFGGQAAPAMAPEPAERLADPAIPRRSELGSVKPEPLAAERKAARRRRLPLGLKLAGIAVLAGLGLLATPSVVGPDQPALATTPKRVALVIGNSAYRHTRRLENPRNDATDISAALRKLGFLVIEGFDLDKAALDKKVRDFVAQLRGAEVGVFFYAGHGLHVSGQNYLVPIDAQLTTASSADVELVRLDAVHRAMEREAATSILFFDACRDNPLSQNLARVMGTRSVEIGRGLAVVESGAGTFISFSTQPGKVALDGKGRNSPYSRALATQLATSNDDLSAMLMAVRKDVMKETDGKQVPWEHSALTARFFFNPAEAPTPAAGGHLRSREAFEAWSATKETANITVLEAFIARFRDTFYAELARARLEELKQATTPSFPSLGDGAPLTSQ